MKGARVLLPCTHCDGLAAAGEEPARLGKFAGLRAMAARQMQCVDNWLPRELKLLAAEDQPFENIPGPASRSNSQPGIGERGRKSEEILERE